jgi:hypothetical protein
MLSCVLLLTFNILTYFIFVVESSKDAGSHATPLGSHQNDADDIRYFLHYFK